MEQAVQLLLPLTDTKVFGPWQIVNECDPAGRALADRHYSRQTIGAARFTRPGKNLILLSPNGDAVWVSWNSNFGRDKRKVYECTLFRNESDYLSSFLIACGCLLLCLCT